MKTEPCTVLIPKVLIVDDQPVLREWIRLFLSPLVGEIIEAADGSEALRLYAQVRPEWVLLDIDMQPMDGLTATRLIKEQFPEARILMVSSHQSEAVRAAAFEAGAVDFICKQDLWHGGEMLEAALVGELA
jgi:CheY-like chemotaxis protein